ncbi:MAG TPA: RHS repeat-associated core domain-containing protein, partial [Bacteroidales bacterium]|nr:RHS repeat-associated core domain-containing protein [Bacteroidales bacterium]
GTDYYPFGMEIPVYGNSDNQLKYNGKELQTEAGLEWYDYGARFYDPVLGRWHVPDPLAEKHFEYTPYAYAFNNPITYIDPIGLDTVAATTAQPIKQDDVVVMEDGTEYTMNADETEIKPDDENNDDQGNDDQQNDDENNSSAGKVMAGTLLISGILLADDATVVGVFDDVAIPALLVAGSITAGAIWLHDQFAEHTSNARKSTWNKHSKKDPGEITGKNRNTNRGDKNKKFEKKPNPNKRTK